MTRLPCSFRSPLTALVSDVRSFTRRRRSRSNRLRSSSSTLGIRTRLSTAASPPVVRQQRAHHLPGVDPIRLALLRLSVHQKARRIEHDRLDRHRSVQPARQPEPLVARFVTAQNTHFTAERAFGLGLLMLDQVLETYDVRCPKRVQADPLTRRALDPDDPTLPAYLDREVLRVVPVARLLPRQRSRLAEPRSPRPFTETTAMCLTSYDYENLFWR